MDNPHGFLNHESLSRTKQGSNHILPNGFPLAGLNKNGYHRLILARAWKFAATAFANKHEI
jgi:hypothetical protein